MQLLSKNRYAYFTYTFIDQYNAGLVLKGTEIKSVRAGTVSLKEAYCYFIDGELWVKNMHISTYAKAGIYTHVAHRDRKLLLSKKELTKLLRRKHKGLTIIPTQLLMTERGLAKLQIALARGKRLYDKREQIKARDLARAQQHDDHT